MTDDRTPLHDAQILMSLAKVKGIPNRRALKLFSSTANQRTNVDPREYFLSLMREYSGSDGMHEWAWEQSGRQLQQSCDADIQVIPFFENDYPERLRRVDDPPVVLFAKGEIGALHRPKSVAIVGTREPTSFGERAALRAGRLAAEAGIPVVSGLALGCDTKAHQGCVEANGTGVAVLANGLDRVYPAANKDLASLILECGGCLVSENPAGAKLTRWAFAYRDRIQSGLSDRVLVIETDVKGGTMHTVKFSQQQQRPLGCIRHPEQFHSEGKTRGNQMLIAAGSAVGISNQDELRDFLIGSSISSVVIETSDLERGQECLALEDTVAVPAAVQLPASVPGATPSSTPDAEPSDMPTSTPHPPAEDEQLTMPLEDS